MKSQFDLVITEVSAAPAMPSLAGQNGGRPSILSQIRLQSQADGGDTLYKQGVWRTTVSRSWHSVK